MGSSHGPQPRGGSSSAAQCGKEKEAEDTLSCTGMEAGEVGDILTLLGWMQEGLGTP